MAEESTRGMALIDALSTNVSTAREVHYRLATIADALGVMGMDRLADELVAMGADVHRTAREAQGEFCRYQNGLNDEQRREVGDMLSLLVNKAA